jgi:hypothetical protein
MYDYQGAIKAGADPNDVVKYLADQTGYNADGAIKAGANQNDVLAYMAKLPLKTAQPSAPNLGQRLATDTNAHAANIVQDLSEKPNLTGALDVAGNVAGEVGDFFGEPIKSAASTLIPQPVKDALMGGVKAVAGTPAAKGVIDAWNTFQAQHPDAAKNIGNVVNIAALFGGGEAAKAAEPAATAVKDELSTTAKSLADNAVTGLAEKMAKTEASQVWDTIKPTLTPTETAEGVKSGTVVTQGPLKTVTQIPKGDDLKMIEAATPYVRDAKTPDVAVFNMQRGIADSATKVRQGLEASDAIWNKNEMKSVLSNVAEPITVKSDATLHNTFNNFKRAVLQLADGADKKTVGILDVRQGLDKLIESEFGPTIYDKTNPMSKVIRDFRSKLNDFAESKIPDGKLPDGSSFKGELKKQSLLYRAIDNTAPKVGKEGSTAITRWIKANPTKAKAIGYGLAGAGIGAGAAHLVGL